MTKVQILKTMFFMVALGVLHVSCVSDEDQQLVVQAHRGGAALYPENTVPAMINAVKIGVRTLELDLQVTKDCHVVVSHDPFVNSTKGLYPNGDRITKDYEDSLLIFSMTYDSLRRYDVGSLNNSCYPRRTNLKCAIPTLSDLIDCVETYTSSIGKSPVCYNIEIKSSTENDGIKTPDYKTFCDLTMEVLKEKKLKNRLCIQSFDPRSLNYIHQKFPSVILSYLVEDRGKSVADFLSELDFIPEIISPDHSIVDKEFVSAAHARNLKVIPWTVDKKDEVLRLNELGVDEIITNEPDSVLSWIYNANRNVTYRKAVQFFENLMGY